MKTAEPVPCNSGLGVPVPDYADLRLDAAAAAATEEYRRQNYEGMRERLAMRKPTEPD